MKNELPVVAINGAEFLVDVDYGLFREKAKPEKFIARDSLKDAGTHYLLKLPGQHATSIPYMVKLDPVGVSRKYGVPVEELPEADCLLKCNPELVADRLQGKLPTIELADHTFFVDLRLGVLRPKDDFSTMGIELEGLPLSKTGNSFQFLYDPKTHTKVNYNNNRTKIPEGTVPLEIPTTASLDPIGTMMRHSDTLAMKYPYGNRDEALEFYQSSIGLQRFLNLHPVRYNLKARVIARQRTLTSKQAARNRGKNTRKVFLQKPKKAKGRGL